jgi:hypothetical protein
MRPAPAATVPRNGSHRVGLMMSLWGAQMRSCSLPVLVNQAAEQVPSIQSAWAILADRGHAGWIWCAAPVAVRDVGARHPFQVATSHDQ